MQNTEQHLLKYAIRIPLPDVLMNRPVEHLQERPDLVDQLKETLDQMESILHDICDKNFAVASDEIHQNYMEIHFETDTDQAKFVRWSRNLTSPQLLHRCVVLPVKKNQVNHLSRML